MKIIESSELEEINYLLSKRNMGTFTISGHIEAFDVSSECAVSLNVEGDQDSDCKDILRGTSAPASYHVDSDDIIPVEPFHPVIGRKRSGSIGSFSMKKQQRRRSSSLGDLLENEPASQKLFLSLVATISEVFSDYDFRKVSANQFVFVDIGTVMRNVNNHLAELSDNHPLLQPLTSLSISSLSSSSSSSVSLLHKIWQSLDIVINSIYKCDIFGYIPKLTDDDSDPINGEGSIWSFNYFFFNRQTFRLAFFSCVATRSGCPLFKLHVR